MTEHIGDDHIRKSYEIADDQHNFQPQDVAFKLYHKNYAIDPKQLSAEARVLVWMVLIESN